MNQASIRNWRTTIVGVASIIGGVAMLLGVAIQIAVAVFDGDPATNVTENMLGQLEVAVGGIVAALVGVGLIQARDAVVSTEETRGEDEF